MITVKVQSGFEAKIEPEQLNDIYFVEAPYGKEYDRLRPR